MNRDPVLIVVTAVMLLVFLCFLALFFSIFRLWLQGLLTHTPVSFADLIRMRLRRVPPTLVVHALISLRQRGVPATVSGVESCYLAFGVGRVSTPTELAELYLAKAREAG